MAATVYAYQKADDKTPLSPYQFGRILVDKWAETSKYQERSQYRKLEQLFGPIIVTWQLDNGDGYFAVLAIDYILTCLKYDDAIKNSVVSSLPFKGREYPLEVAGALFINLYNGVYLPKEVGEYLGARLTAICQPIPLTARTWFNVLIALGAEFYISKKDSGAYKRYVKWEKEFKEHMKLQKFFDNIFKTLETIITLGCSIIVDADTKDNDKVDGSIDNINLFEQLGDRAAQVATETAVDNVTMILDDQRKDLIDAAVKLDERTGFDLSAVTEYVSDVSRSLIEAFESGVTEAVNTTVKAAFDKLKESDEALLQPNSQLKTVQEEIQTTGGLSVALGFKRLFFRKREGQ